MAAAGYGVSDPDLRGPRGWRGSRSDVESRIKALKEQRTEALKELEDALMPDAERQKLEAEHATFHEALHTMVLRGSDDGRSLVAFTPDGDKLERLAMTPLQRKAFDWFVEVEARPRRTHDS
jgi:hypothetical protein